MELARKLNLKPLTDIILGIEGFGEDGFEQFGQQITVTRRIQEALGEYSEGALFKEMIQNAEDANATSVTFYLANKDHSANCKTLFGEGMNDLQGPSIWIHNNAKFTEDDFNNL